MAEDFEDANTPLQERPWDDKKLETYYGRIKHANAEAMYWIASAGGQINPFEAQLEFMLEGLAEAGVITERQKLLMHTNWQINLRSQLVAIREQIEAQIAQQRKAAMTPQLVLPPHIQRGRREV